MSEQQKQPKKRTEYFREYMRRYRKEKKEKIKEITERHWRNKLQKDDTEGKQK